jgi:hypothetical protein
VALLHKAASNPHVSNAKECENEIFDVIFFQWQWNKFRQSLQSHQYSMVCSLLISWWISQSKRYSLAAACVLHGAFLIASFV